MVKFESIFFLTTSRKEKLKQKRDIRFTLFNLIKEKKNSKMTSKCFNHYFQDRICSFQDTDMTTIVEIQ